MDRSDCIVIGLSVAGTAAALKLADSGKNVTLVEAPNEIPMRARPFIWDTPLSKEDRTGADFEALAERALKTAGVHVIRDLESQSISSGDRETTMRLRLLDTGAEFEIAAGRVIYASDGAWNAVGMPAAAVELIGKGVSASAWVDSTFYIGKTAAIIGAGDFAFEQLYWAGQCVSDLWWLCTEPRSLILEDLASRVELPVTPKLRTSCTVKTLRREAGGMVHIGLEDGEKVAVHGAFFTLPPYHSISKGVMVAGSPAGVSWTHYAGAWKSGLNAAGAAL